jgi:hypothetical protein
MTDWLTNINPVSEDYDDRAYDLGKPLPRNFEGSWNYCEFGHYEEGNSPNHRCFNLIEFDERQDCE